MVKEVEKVFDRPTPYTRNAFFIKPATKAKLIATVGLKDELATSKGTPASKYLAPQIFGGQRRIKRFEKALVYAGIMPPGMIAVVPNKPSWAATIDPYGNISSGLIVRLLSYFRAFGQQGYSANMTDKGRKRIAKRGKSANGFSSINGVVYFVSNGSGHLPRGIWAKRGTHGVDVAPVLLFVKPARYIRRLKFFKIALEVVDKNIVNQFNESLKIALSKAG